MPLLPGGNSGPSWATATLTSGPGDEGAGGRVDGAAREAEAGDGSVAFPTVTVKASVVPAEDSGAAKRSNK